MPRARALALSLVALAGCGDGDPPAAARTTADGLPIVAKGDTCPVSEKRFLNEEIAPGLGDGPAYPVGFDDASVMDVVLPPPSASEFRGSEWGGQKTLWAIEPGSSRPLTVRGVRLDGPGEVRFQDGRLPPARLELGPGSDTWTHGASYTRIRAHGCYAFVVEGEGLREVIVFRAGRRSDY